MHRHSKSTITPKQFYYFSDGTGRDSYIVNDNGGMHKPHFSTQMVPKDSQLISNINCFIKRSSSTKSNTNQFSFKVNHYHSDGTGRDNYIVINEGGNSVNNPVRNVTNLAFQLRNYPQSTKVSLNDHYQNSQKQYKTNIIANQILRQRQLDLTQSLSQPKRYSHRTELALKSIENKDTMCQYIQNSRYSKDKLQQIAA